MLIPNSPTLTAVVLCLLLALAYYGLHRRHLRALRALLALPLILVRRAHRHVVQFRAQPKVPCQRCHRPVRASVKLCASCKLELSFGDHS